MTESGGPDKRKEQLLYRALAEFSDACDVPALQPACPFYQLQPHGQPICGEECKDILSDDLSHALPPETLSLGGDLAAVRGHTRPRPRREPSDDQVAFDARQIYLTERDREVSSWGMTALINGLKYQTAWMSFAEDDPPSIDRVEAIAAELRRRGVDPMLVIRQGLFHDIFSSIAWHMRNALPVGSDDLGWVELVRGLTSDFDEIASQAGTDLERVLTLAGDCVTAWILFASLEDLVDHRVRESADELTRHSKGQLPPRDHDSVWLVERFTSTYVENWSPKSLRREWRYIHSQHAGPCAPAHMRERVVALRPIAVLLAEIGSRHIEGHETETGHAPAGLIKVDQFLPLAVDALRRGDRAEATSIYRTVYAIRSDDREVANNLGFCLLPDSPSEAAEYFEQSIKMASAPGPLAAMTQLNLALARLITGDIEAASQSLRSARENRMADFSGYMWDLDEFCRGRWKMSHIRGDLSEYAGLLEEIVEGATM